MRAKKWITILVAILLPVVFVGCSNDEPKIEEQPTIEDPTAEDPAIEDPVTEDPTTEDPKAEDPNDDDEEVKDPEELSYFESMLGDDFFKWNGNEYSIMVDVWYKFIPNWQEMFLPQIFYLDAGYSLRSLNKETEVFEDWIINDVDVLRIDVLKNCPVEHIYPFGIDAKAFDGCKKLRTIYFKQFCDIIGTTHAAFKGCDNLKDMYVYAPFFVESGKFALDYDKVTLHVGPGKIDEFRQEEPWKNFKNIVDDYDLPIPSINRAINRAQRTANLK